MSNDDKLRFPIGKFAAQESYSLTEVKAHIDRIAALPQKVETLAKSFSPQQLETPYRDGGWTARQVIHHLADSHLNAYIRIKWTLTENTPTIKAYDEKQWAETPDVAMDPMVAVHLLKALHVKFAGLLRSISEQDLKKQFLHPETQKHVSIERMTALYAWHGDHHLGHLQIIAAR